MPPVRPEIRCVFSFTSPMIFVFLLKASEGNTELGSVALPSFLGRVENEWNQSFAAEEELCGQDVVSVPSRGGEGCKVPTYKLTFHPPALM